MPTPLGIRGARKNRVRSLRTPCSSILERPPFYRIFRDGKIPLQQVDVFEIYASSIMIEITDLGHGVIIAQYLQRGRLLKVVPIITGKGHALSRKAASHRSISPNKFREISAIHALSHSRLVVLSNLSPVVIILQSPDRWP
jgi:hypothetical protein